MRAIAVTELYIPYGEEFGWIRTRGRWGGVSTFVVSSVILDGMAMDIMEDPGIEPVIDPTNAMRSRQYASAWPPKEPPQVWLVRTPSQEGEMVWVKRA